MCQIKVSKKHYNIISWH